MRYIHKFGMILRSLEKF